MREQGKCRIKLRLYWKLLPLNRSARKQNFVPIDIKLKNKPAVMRAAGRLYNKIDSAVIVSSIIMLGSIKLHDDNWIHVVKKSSYKNNCDFIFYPLSLATFLPYLLCREVILCYLSVTILKWCCSSSRYIVVSFRIVMYAFLRFANRPTRFLLV